MDFINKGIADFVFFIGREAGAFWENLVLLQFSWPQVIIDILLVSIVFYYLFILLKGSRAIHILIGLAILAFVFILSKALQLFATGWLLDRFLTLILVAIPVIFQQELRRGLEKLGQTRLFTSHEVQASNILISNLVEASITMAKEKMGALIVLNKEVSLAEYAETGVPINGKMSKELLLNIFFPKSPLHDGAVIIKGDTIVAAACVLPHSYKMTDRSLGTRHKAAIGLAENTDAHIIVISEEKGTISYAHDGRLERNIPPEKLQQFLEEFYRPKNKRGKALFKKEKTMKIFLANWELKVLAVLAAIIFWFLVVGTENSFYTFPEEIPVKAFNVSEDLVVAEDLGTATLRLKIDNRESIANLVADDFSAFVDLEGLGEGEREVDIEVSSKSSDISVVKVEPARINVKIEQKSAKEVPIEYILKGEVKEGYQVKEVTISNENTIIKGSQKTINEIDSASLIIELNGEDQDINNLYPLKVFDGNGEEIPNISLDNEEIEAQITITPITDQKIAGVQPTIVGTPNESVWIKAINVDPSFVVLEGDREALKELDFVQTSDIDVKDLAENKDFTVSIIGLPEDVSVEGSGEISISIEVERYGSVGASEQRKTVNVPVVIEKRKIFQKNITIDPLSVTLIAEGSEEELNKLNSKLKVELDIYELDGGEAIFDLNEYNFNLPEGVNMVSVTPSTITVTWK